MKRKKSKSNPVKAKILIVVLRIFSMLPFAITRSIGGFIGRMIWYSNAREKVVSVKNIALCFPELDEAHQRALARRSCIHSGMVFTESAWIWLNSNKKVASRLQVEGIEHVKQALDKGRGVILTGPHLGNWEALLAWGGMNLSSSGMYRVPKILELDPLIRKAREKTGVDLIVADHKSVRHMLKTLKSGNAFMLLSDQNPVMNSGVYAPFFNRPAYTMTLVQRLIEKTGTQLVFFHAERVKTGFVIKFKPAKFDLNQSTAEDFATMLNLELETQIRSCPEQYEWGYKRFRPQPDGKVFY